MLLTLLLVYIKNKQSWMLTKVVRIDFNHNNYCNREEESPAWTELNFTKTGVQRFFFKIGSARGKAPAAAAAAKSLQSCPTLCNPRDSSPQGFPVPGILQARTLDWVVISFSNAWKWKVKVRSLSCISLLATPRTAAYQAPPSMGFSRQEYWSGVPLPSLPSLINKQK